MKEKCLEEIAEKDEIIDDLEEDDNMDLINPSCYANIDGISIFFQKNEKIHLVFFWALTISSKKKNFKEDVKDALLLLWSSIDDLKNLLAQEKFKLEEMNIKNFDVLAKDDATNFDFNCDTRATLFRYRKNRRSIIFTWSN